jgi:hypothetical protein
MNYYSICCIISKAKTDLRLLFIHLMHKYNICIEKKKSDGGMLHAEKRRYQQNYDYRFGTDHHRTSL